MATRIGVRFADTGDVTVIPNAAQGNGNVSFTDGFTPNYSIADLNDPNRRRVPRLQSNYLYQVITDNIKEWQEQTYPVFVTAANNGGTALNYPHGARVALSNGVFNDIYQVVDTAGVNTAPPSRGWRREQELYVPVRPSTVGSALSVTNFQSSNVAVLDVNTVVIADDGNLQAYRFNGSSWSTIGSSIAITTGSMTAISSNRIVYAAGGNLTTYEFSGSAWSQVGNSFATGDTFSVVSATGQNRVAFIGTTNNQLRMYSFDGTDWSLEGSGLTLTTPDWLSSVNGSDVALLRTDGGLRTLYYYRFNGSTWSQVGTGLTFTANERLNRYTAINGAYIIGAIQNLTDVTHTLAVFRFDGDSFEEISRDNPIASNSMGVGESTAGNEVVVSDLQANTMQLYSYSSYVGNSRLDLIT